MSHTLGSSFAFSAKPSVWEGYVPTRTVRVPPSVRPRCKREVAPSLCEGRVKGSSPHQTWASITPKWPWVSMHCANSDMRREPSVSTCSRLILHTASSLRAPARCLNKLLLTSRNAFAKAMKRGGARCILPALPKRGTKSSLSAPSWGSVCQSDLSIASLLSFSKPHLLQRGVAFSRPSTGQSSTSPEKGPSGSSRRNDRRSKHGASTKAAGARQSPSQQPYISGCAGSWCLKWEVRAILEGRTFSLPFILIGKCGIFCMPESIKVSPESCPRRWSRKETESIRVCMQICALIVLPTSVSIVRGKPYFGKTATCASLIKAFTCNWSCATFKRSWYSCIRNCESKSTSRERTPKILSCSRPLCSG
mmetsp:Transcript_36796/g.99562  ORF Transcript_36796/g.99562 Transcript_36796/m.99562 type:complete len:364 (-) Transcript_36796:45-1136(-)